MAGTGAAVRCQIVRQPGRWGNHERREPLGDAVSHVTGAAGIVERAGADLRRMAVHDDEYVLVEGPLPACRTSATGVVKPC